jgi:hypothetical protein
MTDDPTIAIARAKVLSFAEGVERMKLRIVEKTAFYAAVEREIIIPGRKEAHKEAEAPKMEPEGDEAA